MRVTSFASLRRPAPTARAPAPLMCTKPLHRQQGLCDLGQLAPPKNAEAIKRETISRHSRNSLGRENVRMTFRMVSRAPASWTIFSQALLARSSVVHKPARDLLLS